MKIDSSAFLIKNLDQINWQDTECSDKVKEEIANNKEFSNKINKIKNNVNPQI